MKRLVSVPTFCVGLAAALLSLIAIADPATRTTKITFSAPVRVPGKTLSAGTYYFKAPNASNRALVKIEDANRKFVTQFMGIRDYTRKRDHEIVIFGDHPCGSNAIKSWFYPHSGYGVRFVYPKEEAAEIAASCGEPVPETHDNNVNESQLDTATVYLMSPKKAEEPYNVDALARSDEQDRQGYDGGLQD